MNALIFQVEISSNTIQLLLAAGLLVVALVVAGIFIKPGTYRVGIDVQDRIIAAFRVAEELAEKKRAELEEQLRLTEGARDALKKQLADEQGRGNRLERLIANLTLEQETSAAARLSMQVRITQLEAVVEDLQAQVKGHPP